MQTIVTGPHSILQRIRHSDDFTTMLEEAIAKQDSNPIKDSRHVKSLSNALHRFDSRLRPMTRFVLLMDSILSVAYEISIVRLYQAESRDAISFLEFVSGDPGMERLVLLALFADAGDMTLALLRFFDTEDSDAAQISDKIRKFVNEIDWAFTHGNIIGVAESHTALMMKNLEQTRTFVVGGKPCTVGHASAYVRRTTFSRALKRVCAWVVLTTATLQAEFPEWEVLQSFSIFNLQAVQQHDMTNKVQRLAQTFDLPFQPVCEQLQRLLPQAKRFKAAADPQLSNFDAWRSVWQSAGGQSKLPELTQLLARYGAYSGCTTSGVEHCHSIQDWLWPPRRRNLLCDRENDEMQIVMDQDMTERLGMDAAIEMARRIWRIFYGKARLHLKPRRDVGKKRGERATCTLAAWKGNLRNALTDASASWDAGGAHAAQGRAAREAEQCWTEAHDKELAFQLSKRTEEFLHSMAERTLLPSEVTAADEALSQTRLTHLLELRRARKQAAAGKEKRLQSGQSPSIMVNSHVYIEDDLACGSCDNPAQMVALRGCTLVRNRHEAQVFVVNRPATLSPCTEWTVVLNGGLVIDLAFLRNGAGSAIAYHAAVAVKRAVWCSSRFKHQHAAEYAILANSIGRPHSRWLELDDAAFSNAVAKDAARPARQRRPLDNVGLATHLHAQQLALTNVFAPAEFIIKFRKVSRVTMGACGL